MSTFAVEDACRDGYKNWKDGKSSIDMLYNSIYDLIKIYWAKSSVKGNDEAAMDLTSDIVLRLQNGTLVPEGYKNDRFPWNEYVSKCAMGKPRRLHSKVTKDEKLIKAIIHSKLQDEFSEEYESELDVANLYRQLKGFYLHKTDGLIASIRHRLHLKRHLSADQNAFMSIARAITIDTSYSIPKDVNYVTALYAGLFQKTLEENIDPRLLASLDMSSLIRLSKTCSNQLIKVPEWRTLRATLKRSALTARSLQKSKLLTKETFKQLKNAELLSINRKNEQSVQKTLNKLIRASDLMLKEIVEKAKDDQLTANDLVYLYQKLSKTLAL